MLFIYCVEWVKVRYGCSCCVFIVLNELRWGIVVHVKVRYELFMLFIYCVEWVKVRYGCSCCLFIVLNELRWGIVVHVVLFIVLNELRWGIYWLFMLCFYCVEWVKVRYGCSCCVFIVLNELRWGVVLNELRWGMVVHVVYLLCWMS